MSACAQPGTLFFFAGVMGEDPVDPDGEAVLIGSNDW
jgi:hypothetical protein